MTIFKFQLLDYNQQIDILYKEGVYIGKRKVSSSTIVLYQLDSFYIEVFYKKYRYFISRINCYYTTDILNPYLEQIDVKELVRVCEK